MQTEKYLLAMRQDMEKQMSSTAFAEAQKVFQVQALMSHAPPMGGA